MDLADFPVLGTEPISVEFANTLYGTGPDRIDFLATPESISQWLSLIPGQGPGLAGATVQVRALRDAVRDVLLAAIDQATPSPAALDTINAVAAAAPTYLRLDWADHTPVASRLDSSTFGRIANCCIGLVSGPRVHDLRRCASPDCTLLFVRAHQRRRYCHPSCAHRDRQARYYRRHTIGATS
ncbi:CGNR zinc finger domain-containing protein [Nonomuraea sp. NPDC048881]|uniref:CGNR zinc finger domain-containing protein n=1 Tax=Nonomuraea sp. NPDC048881 TaxID=3155030 RepID=UPI0033E3C9A4